MLLEMLSRLFGFRILFWELTVVGVSKLSKPCPFGSRRSAGIQPKPSFCCSQAFASAPLMILPWPSATRPSPPTHVHTHTHTSTFTHRHTDTQSHRHTDTRPHTHTQHRSAPHSTAQHRTALHRTAPHARRACARTYPISFALKVLGS